MKRLLACAFAALLAAPLIPAPAAAQTTIRISTAAPPSDFLAKSVEQFKAKVDKGGAGLKAEAHVASTLFRQSTEVPAIQRGTLEKSTMTTFEVAQQIPELGFLNRAFAFRDYPHMRAVFDGPLGAEYRATGAEKMGIQILSTAYLGTRQLNLVKKRKVAAPQDLAGLKVRMPAGPDWLLLGQTLGVSPLPMGMPEVYLAMKTGSIDGQESPLSNLNAAKLYEVSEQVILTSHMVQPVLFATGKPLYDKLTDAQKKALEAAATSAAKANDEGRLADEKSIVEALKGRGLVVETIDLAPFKALADSGYSKAEAAKAWNMAFAKKIEETK